MNRSKSRLAQSANNSAIVVIIIAVLIILYILFLPPEDRAALLGEQYNGNGGSTGGTGANVQSNLLSKNPGRVFPTGKNMVEHTMPSFIVFTVTNANELKRMDSLYAKSSVFSDQVGELVFFYDPKTMSDLKLSFNVQSHSGKLKVTLNGYSVFEGEVADGSPPPISLPKEYMTAKNSLKFEVSSVGAAFWRINDYQLENVLVVGTVTDYSSATSEQHFSIADTEFQKLDKATLEFVPDCPPKEGGQVQILLNSRPVYTSYPDCGIKTSIEISKEFFKTGDNALLASTSAGSFLMDAPKVTTFLKESSQPIFYFNAPANLLDALYSGQRSLLLTIRFSDATNSKKGLVEINSFQIPFDTQAYLFQENVQPESVLEGPNAVKIIPLSDPVDVTELRIDVI